MNVSKHRADIEQLLTRILNTICSTFTRCLLDRVNGVLY